MVQLAGVVVATGAHLPQPAGLSARLCAKSNKSHGCRRSGAAPHAAGAGRFFTVRSFPRHLRTPGCPYSPLSIVLAHSAQKCAKSSFGFDLPAREPL